MQPDFNLSLDRRSIADCKKWNLYDADVLPMWVADMDFAVAEPILSALRNRLEHPVFGYAKASSALREAIVGWLWQQHQWRIEPDDLVFLPGVEPGFNMALKALLRPGDGVVVQTPMYQPILSAPGHWQMRRIDAPLTSGPQGFAMDAAALDAALGQARAFLFCNPHNPTGKVFTEAELRAILASCERHDAPIISDEIHCDLVYAGHRHRPLAALSPEASARTITLMSASKTFNIAGLKTAFAIITNPVLRDRFEASRSGMVDSVNVMGLEATRAAFLHGEAWRQAAIAYLAANRDHLAEQLARRFPEVSWCLPQASFLAWLDCSALGSGPEPQDFFLTRAKVGLSAGTAFGPDCEGHVRLNFGCTRGTLDAALDRMQRALGR
jgi:cystathionine beta-lyase